jgi:hypothetical protein
MTQETIERAFQVGSPAYLILSNVCGSVDIQPGEEGWIRVKAVKRVHTGEGEGTEIECSQQADGTVTVRTRFREAWGWLIGLHPCGVDYTVEVPAACSLRLRGVSNTARVQGLEGDFDLASVSGEISLHALAGRVKIQTVSGSVFAEGFSGSLALRAVSADADFKQATVHAAEVNTVSGRLDMQTPFEAGPYCFRSVSGDVRLKVPPESHCLLELHSVSGGIRSDLPLSRTTQWHRSQEAEVQGGGVTVSLTSVSGNLALTRDGGSPQPAMPAHPSKASARLAVLGSLERGEMTVDEALVRLRG